MQLKKIELINFRQYISQTIEFSTDPQKNVTLIIGDGGSGKTTLSQAFTWVLYEKVDFTNKILLNSKIGQELDKGKKAQTRVQLFFSHCSKDYIISRVATYIKNSVGNIKQDGDIIAKLYEVNDGNQKLLSDLERHSVISGMMPEELSRYFFFDGEKIEKMSKELERGKGGEFSSAIQGLLGLSSLQNVKKHLDPSKVGSVFGYYDKKIEEKSDSQVRELGDEIQKDQSRLDSIKKSIVDLTNLIENYNKKVEDISEQLLQFKEAEDSQRQYRLLEYRRNEESNKKTVKTKSLLCNFHSSNTISYCSKDIMIAALGELKSGEIIDKGIPDIQARTIDYLIREKKCICGHCVEVDSPEYKALLELKDYIPPKNVGGAIHDLKNDITNKVESTKRYFDNIKENMEDIRHAEQAIRNIDKDLELVDKSLLNNKEQAIRELKQRQNEYKSRINQMQNHITSKSTDIGALQERINRNTNARNELILKTSSNEKYSLYREYARALYDEICSTYDVEESVMRDKFTVTINEMFRKIYGVGMVMEIDSNYNISVQVEEITNGDNDLDHSTSQNYSVIFAFIATIMKLNRKDDSKHSENIVKLDKENYPLVMDAPLSAFDKSRIANICSILPEIAEQTVVFIKDTDGDIASEHLKNKIGKAYRIEMNGLIDSKIIPEVI
ncbi:MAG: AAA family ATPase [Clostridiales bacterium]|nr:AAA family ATPase [Clostridiales bacterium]